MLMTRCDVDWEQQESEIWKRCNKSHIFLNIDQFEWFLILCWMVQCWSQDISTFGSIHVSMFDLLIPAFQNQWVVTIRRNMFSWILNLVQNIVFHVSFTQLCSVAHINEEVLVEKCEDLVRVAVNITAEADEDEEADADTDNCDNKNLIRRFCASPMAHVTSDQLDNVVLKCKNIFLISLILPLLILILLQTSLSLMIISPTQYWTISSRIFPDQTSLHLFAPVPWSWSHENISSPVSQSVPEEQLFTSVVIMKLGATTCNNHNPISEGASTNILSFNCNDFGENSFGRGCCWWSFSDCEQQSWDEWHLDKESHLCWYECCTGHAPGSSWLW